MIWGVVFAGLAVFFAVALVVREVRLYRHVREWERS